MILQILKEKYVVPKKLKIYMKLLHNSRRRASKWSTNNFKKKSHNSLPDYKMDNELCWAEILKQLRGPDLEASYWTAMLLI